MIFPFRINTYSKELFISLPNLIPRVPILINGFQARPTPMDPTWAVHHSCASWAPKKETSPAAYRILSLRSIQLCSWLLNQIPYGLGSSELRQSSDFHHSSRCSDLQVQGNVPASPVICKYRATCQQAQVILWCLLEVHV